LSRFRSRRRACPGSDSLPACGLVDSSPVHPELLLWSIRTRREYPRPGPLWAVPLPRPTAADRQPHGLDAAWSPDGSEIVVARDRELYRASADGGNLRRIAGVAGFRSGRAGRPIPGHSLHPLRLQVDTSSLWEVARDGTHLHPLLAGWNTPPLECCGSWTPDGEFFVFQASATAANIWAIRERRLSGTRQPRPVRLTFGQFSAQAPCDRGKKLFSSARCLAARCCGSIPEPPGRAFLPGLSPRPRFSRGGQSWLSSRTLRALCGARLRWRRSPPVDLPSHGVRLPAGPGWQTIAFSARCRPTWKAYLIAGREAAPRTRPGAAETSDATWSRR